MAAANPRDILPFHAIFGFSLLGLGVTCPSLAAELPLHAKLVLGGMFMLLLVSHELHRSRVNKAIAEANAKNQKVIASNPLPRKFTLKLMTEMQVTPAEFTDALSNPDLLN